MRTVRPAVVLVSRENSQLTTSGRDTMRRSFLWIALGLLATSSGQGNGKNKLEDYLCKTAKICIPETQATTENPPCGEDGQCVPYSHCETASVGGFEGGELDFIRPTFEGCDYLHTCCKREDIRPPKVPKYYPNQCGKRNHARVFLEDDSHEAQYAEFPWMVGVLRTPTGSSNSEFVCGGSLIHPRVVLTAAHHVKGKDNLVVTVGEWDTQTQDEPYQTQIRRVRQVIIHEEFEYAGALNDVALLILEQPVDMSQPNVGLICLPDANENMEYRNCVTSGWGKDVFGTEGKFQTILKKIDDLPMVPRSRCQEALRKTKLGPGFKLHESFVCAGGIKGKDSCTGDGGGPLVCPSKTNPDTYVQAGIVAWGIGCHNEYPAAYVNVPHFVKWIENKLQAEDISLYS